jgi:hypothetical protein
MSRKTLLAFAGHSCCRMPVFNEGARVGNISSATIQEDAMKEP